jgi:hypothetical protein
MQRRITLALAILVAIGATVALLSGKHAGRTLTSVLTIATASVDGPYYSMGGAIARFLNQKSDQYGFRVVVEPTESSGANVAKLESGEVEFAIVQANVEYEAVNGLGDWSVRGPQKDLRAISSLHEEMVTVVASRPSGIAALADLRGRRVAIGGPGSGHRHDAIEVLRSVELDWQRDLTGLEIDPSEAVRELAAGRTDAFFYTGGHPSAVIREAILAEPGVRFVPLSSVARLLSGHPYYHAAAISPDLYPRAAIAEPVATVAGVAVLLTTEQVDERYAYAVASTIFENLAGIRELHPAFAALDAARMRGGFAAPLHPGARRYFDQRG